MATIISASNQKGGVGKTVTSVNLSAGLARHGKRVLLVDVDAQGSATLTLGYNPDSLSITLADVIQSMINDVSFEPTNAILHHEEGIDLLPANITLSVTELSLMNVIGRETILKKYLEMVQKSYDFIILDCLPSLNILAINALTASNQVIIPVQAQHLSVNGMQQLLATIAKIRRYLNPTLEIAGILPTMINARTKSMRDIMDLLHTTYDGKLHIYENYIPQSIRATEFSLNGKSIYKYEPNGKVTKAYESLVQEVLANGC